MQTFVLTGIALAAFVFGALWMQEAKPGRFTHPVSKDADGGMARWMQTMQPGATLSREACDRAFAGSKYAVAEFAESR